MAKNLIVIDLCNLGSAYSIINRFVDSEVTEVFEVSPMGTGSILILNVQDAVSGEIIFNNIRKEYKADIQNISLITGIQEMAVKVYLSQFQSPILKNILIIESTQVSKIFSIADVAANNANIGLVDFRVVRTNPCNAILVLTSDNVVDLMSFKNLGAKTTIINDVQNSVKEFFEIIKV